LGHDKRPFIHIRFNLAPDGALGGPAGTQESADADAVFGGDLQIVVDGEGAAFHDGAQHVGAGGAVREAKENAAGDAAPQRRAFACPVGQEDQPVCARRRLVGLQAE
jgi:hypothetical protein